MSNRTQLPCREDLVSGDGLKHGDAYPGMTCTPSYRRGIRTQPSPNNGEKGTIQHSYNNQLHPTQNTG